jgi:hypothetical protein
MRKRSFWRVLLTRSLNLLETRFSNRIELSGKKSRTLVISFKERLNRPGFCGGGFAGDGGRSTSRRTFTVSPFIVIVADCELLLGVLKKVEMDRGRRVRGGLTGHSLYSGGAREK